MKRTVSNEVKKRSENTMTTAVRYQGRRVKDPAAQHVEQINAIGRNNIGDEQQLSDDSGEDHGDGSDLTASHKYHSGEDDEEGRGEDEDDVDEEEEEEEYSQSQEGALYYDSQDELSEEEDHGQDDGQSNEAEERDSFSDSSDSDVEVDEEISKFLYSFPELKVRYKFLEKIGEGTFSSVYKAIDLHYDKYINPWDIDRIDDTTWDSPPLKSKRHNGSSRTRRKKKYVAVKKIYVTSSPTRIQNELELLRDLQGSDNVVSLITAFRSDDQVVAVMPYFKHVDFRVRHIVLFSMQNG